MVSQFMSFEANVSMCKTGMWEDFLRSLRRCWVGAERGRMASVVASNLCENISLCGGQGYRAQYGWEVLHFDCY